VDPLRPFGCSSWAPGRPAEQAEVLASRRVVAAGPVADKLETEGGDPSHGVEGRQGDPGDAAAFADSSSGKTVQDISAGRHFSYGSTSLTVYSTKLF
jgi:hypothetical protein